MKYSAFMLGLFLLVAVSCLVVFTELHEGMRNRVSGGAKKSARSTAPKNPRGKRPKKSSWFWPF